MYIRPLRPVACAAFRHEDGAKVAIIPETDKRLRKIILRMASARLAEADDTVWLVGADMAINTLNTSPLHLLNNIKRRNSPILFQHCKRSQNSAFFISSPFRAK